jgi:hypothetical protein
MILSLFPRVPDRRKRTVSKIGLCQNESNAEISMYLVCVVGRIIRVIWDIIRIIGRISTAIVFLVAAQIKK